MGSWGSALYFKTEMGIVLGEIAGLWPLRWKAEKWVTRYGFDHFTQRHSKDAECPECYFYLHCCTSLLNGGSLLSYLPGCCHFVLDTGLLSLRLHNYFEQWVGCWIFFFSTIEIFFPTLPVSSQSPPFNLYFYHSFCSLSISICLPSLSHPFHFLPSSSIFIFSLHCFHHSSVIKLHISLLSVPKGKRC